MSRFFRTGLLAGFIAAQAGLLMANSEADIDSTRTPSDKGTSSQTASSRLQLAFKRMSQHEGQLNAVIAKNPNASSIASKLDADRINGLVKGPLHGLTLAGKPPWILNEANTDGN